MTPYVQNIREKNISAEALPSHSTVTNRYSEKKMYYDQHNSAGQGTLRVVTISSRVNDINFPQSSFLSKLWLRRRIVINTVMAAYANCNEFSLDKILPKRQERNNHRKEADFPSWTDESINAEPVWFPKFREGCTITPEVRAAKEDSFYQTLCWCWEHRWRY
jgi:hypothetical protein